MSKYSKEKVLVLGGTGMAGSTIVEQLKQVGFDVYWTSRNRSGSQDYSRGINLQVTSTVNAYKNLSSVISKVKPKYIVNALRGYEDEMFLINSVVPAILEQIRDTRVINISSNAVFQNAKSKYYASNAQPRPITEYGMSKWLGERSTQLTIRTSIVGVPVWDIDPTTYIRRCYTSNSLRKYSWNGITNLMLAKIVTALIINNCQVFKAGVLHVCSTSKPWAFVVSELSNTYKTNDYLIVQKSDSLPLLLKGYKVKPTLSQQISNLVSSSPYDFSLEDFHGITNYIYTR